MTKVSAEVAGMANYTVKRDFRRELDQEIRREGHDYFWPNHSIPLGNQPFPNAPNTDQPISLIHLARRPNGATAVIAGTATTLFRFFALDNGNYFEGSGAAAYIRDEDTYTENSDSTGAWMVIGSDFSPNAQRWEAHNINGYTIFNNGVDLPMTYRVEETRVQPIYELREQGIAAVGTIAEYNGLLICGDVSQIVEGQLPELLSNINPKSITALQTGSVYSGLSTASLNQGSLIVVSTGSFNQGNGFTGNMVGKYFRFSNGFTRQIATVINPGQIILSGNAPTADMLDLPFYVVDLGNNSPDFVVTASSNFFTPDLVGQNIIWENPIALFTASLLTDEFTSNAHGLFDGNAVKLDADAGQILPDGFEPGIYYVRDATPNTFRLSKSFAGEAVDVITNGTGYVARVDVTLGTSRKITAFISPTQVRVDSDISVSAGSFSVTSKNAYAAFTEQSKIDRIQYRLLWSMPDEPRRFAAVLPGTIAAGSNILTFKYSTRSFSSGQQVLVLGAGVLGGNLIATIEYLADGIVAVLDAFAQTSVVDASVQAFDSVDSVVGFYDLQDDSSGVLRMLPLRGTLVIYKDTSIFLGNYTGQISSPFEFARVYRGSKTLFYRYALMELNGAFHVYPGRNAFYRFDLTTQTPQEESKAELISDLFFKEAKLENTNFIFAADNAITKEVFICFPSASADKAICFDYANATFSTTSAEYTAAATIRKPLSGALIGATEEWFCMGTREGALLQYGLSSGSPPGLYHRLGEPYDSVLQSGLISFGDDFNEKDLTGYVLHLAAQSPDAALLFELFGTSNAAKAVDLLANLALSSPNSANLVSMFKRSIYFQDRITVSGLNNPCRISARTFNIAAVRSMSLGRRPQ